MSGSAILDTGGGKKNLGLPIIDGGISIFSPASQEHSQ